MRKIALIIFLLMIPALAGAENIIAMHLEVGQEGNARLLSAEVKDDFVFLPADSGNYKISLLGKDKELLFASRFEPNFYWSTIGEVEYDTLFIKIPWNPLFHYVKVYKGDEEIGFESLSPLICNSNMKCEQEQGESEYLCGLECSSSSGQELEQSGTKSSEGSENPVFYYALLLILAVLTLLLFRSIRSEQ